VNSDSFKQFKHEIEGQRKYQQYYVSWKTNNILISSMGGQLMHKSSGCQNIGGFHGTSNLSRTSWCHSSTKNMSHNLHILVAVGDWVCFPKFLSLLCNLLYIKTVWRSKVEYRTQNCMCETNTR
jgi:hypothetical protein